MGLSIAKIDFQVRKYDVAMIRLNARVGLALSLISLTGCAGTPNVDAKVVLDIANVKSAGPNYVAASAADSNGLADLQTNHALLIDPTFTAVAVFSMTEAIPRSETTLLEAPIPGLSRHSNFDVLTLRPLGAPRFSESVVIQELATGLKVTLSLPGGSKVTSPAWSPDGSMLAFVLENNQIYELWVGSRETGKTRRISSQAINLFLWGQYSRRIDAASSELPFVPYQWAPQGDRIYYAVSSERDFAAIQAVYKSSSKADIRVSDNALESGSVSDETIRSEVGRRLADSMFLSRIIASSVRHPETYSFVSPERNFTALTISPDGAIIIGITTDIVGSQVLHKAYKISAEDRDLGFEALDDINVGPRDLLSIVWGAGDDRTLYALNANSGKYCIEKHDLALGGHEIADCLSEGVAPTRALGSTLAYTDESVLLTTTSGKIRTYDRQSGVMVAAVPYPEFDDNYFWDPLTVGAGQSLALGNSNNEILIRGRLKRDDLRRNSSFAALASFSIESGETHQVWSREYSDGEWLVSQFADNSGNIYYSKETPSSPRNLFRLSVEDNQSAQLTCFEDPFPEFYDYQVRILSYDRADGVPLTARLILPKVEPGSIQRFPMLVWQYPGTSVRPISERFRDGMFVRPNRHRNHMGRWLPLAMLEHGYAILYPDIPLLGIDGEDEYASYVEQTIAGAEAAVDAAVETGLVDKSRIAIGGSSFGGHSATLLLAHTDMFAAGISSAGLAHWFYRPNSMQYDPRSYWDYPKGYFDRSPLLLAENIKEPLLLIHGLDDERPPASQSISLFNTIESLNGTAKLILLENESHNIEILENQLMIQDATLHWLRTYLREDFSGEGERK